ncbi:uncharacterized protein PITG_22578, partial [Phytophthora infestans T30-4]
MAEVINPAAPALVRCQGTKETLEHIFWDCACAQVCWQKLICQWTGECWTQATLHNFQKNCASRQAPELSKTITEKLRNLYPDEASQSSGLQDKGKYEQSPYVNDGAQN